MIEYVKGDILEAKTDAIVNTVNCVGIMGKGLALKFKEKYPRMFEAYRALCQAGHIKPGYVHTFAVGSFLPPFFVINFPTKRHWWDNSRLEDIDSGLEALAYIVKKTGISSISIPPLGCGLGGLDWQVVRPMIEKVFWDSQVKVYLYEPDGESNG